LVKRFTYKRPKLHTSPPVAFKASRASVVKCKIFHEIQLLPLSHHERQAIFLTLLAIDLEPLRMPALLPLTQSKSPDASRGIPRLKTQVKRLTRAPRNVLILYRRELNAEMGAIVNTTCAYLVNRLTSGQM
jgi:hypothetical protein